MVHSLSQYESIIFYIAVILISVFFMHYAVKLNSKVLLIVLILIISSVIGFRYQVGRDYWSYASAYEIITSKPTLVEAHKWYSIEESFFLISFLTKIWGGTFQSVLLIYGFLTTFFFLMGIWYFRKDIRVEWAILYYSTTLFFGSFNTIRQYLAMAIIFYAFRYVIEKKPIRYCVYVLLAMFFHTSAFIAILVYFYGTEKSWSGKVFRYLNYVLPFILIFGTNQLMSFINKFELGRFENYTISTQFGIGIFIQIIIVYLYFRSVKNGENSITEEKAFFVKELVVLSTILCILDYTLGDASRIRNYFSTIEMVVMSSYPSIIFRNKCKLEFPNITIYDAFLLVYYFWFLIVPFFNRDVWVYPYQFIFRI